MEEKIMTCIVKNEWVDYNGHLNDAEYARIFSLAVEELMVKIGIDETFREKQSYSIFTLETHLCYLAEASEGEKLNINLQLLDYDSKRMHIFFTMKNEENDMVATSEQMLMGMDMKEGRPGEFPKSIHEQIETIAEKQKDMSIPEQVGRTIGIRRR